MNLPQFALVSVLLCGYLMAGPALAHSGGLDADGCHAGSKPYHCHRPQNDSTQQQRGQEGVFGDRNCADFATWRAAQDFFENAGADDPHGLDRDHDGIACEGLQ